MSSVLFDSFGDFKRVNDNTYERIENGERVLYDVRVSDGIVRDVGGQWKYSLDSTVDIKRTTDGVDYFVVNNTYNPDDWSNGRYIIECCDKTNRRIDNYCDETVFVMPHIRLNEIREELCRYNYAVGMIVKPELYGKRRTAYKNFIKKHALKTLDFCARVGIRENIDKFIDKNDIKVIEVSDDNFDDEFNALSFSNRVRMYINLLLLNRENESKIVLSRIKNSKGGNLSEYILNDLFHVADVKSIVDILMTMPDACNYVSYLYSHSLYFDRLYTSYFGFDGDKIVFYDANYIEDRDYYLEKLRKIMHHIELFRDNERFLLLLACKIADLELVKDLVDRGVSLSDYSYVKLQNLGNKSLDYTYGDIIKSVDTIKCYDYIMRAHGGILGFLYYNGKGDKNLFDTKIVAEMLSCCRLSAQFLSEYIDDIIRTNKADIMALIVESPYMNMDMAKYYINHLTLRGDRPEMLLSFMAKFGDQLLDNNDDELSLDGESESLWRYKILASGEVILEAYSGDESIVRIPTTIDGRVVKSMSMSFFSTNVLTSREKRARDGIKVVYVDDARMLSHVSFPKDVIVCTYKNECKIYADTIVYGTRECGIENDFIWARTRKETMILRYIGNSTAVNVPSTIGGYDVDTLSPNMFVDKNVESIKLEDGFKAISPKFCYDLTSLRHIIMPDSITRIEYSAFSQCCNLESVIMPKSLIEIEDCAFASNTKLSTVIFNDKLLKIGEYAFQNTNIEFIDFPLSLVEIGKVAFYNTKLKEVFIPKNVKRVGYSAFSGCNTLEKLIIDGNNWNSGDIDEAFKDINVSEIIIREGMKYLPDKIFASCPHITKVSLPDSLETIGYDAFLNCPKLNSLTLPNGVKHLAINHLGFNGAKVVTIYANSHLESVTSDFMFNSVRVVYSGTNRLNTDKYSDKYITYTNLSEVIGDVVVAPKLDGSYRVVGLSNYGENISIHVRYDDVIISEIDGNLGANDSVKHVYIDDGILEISPDAFNDFKALLCVRLPSDLVKLRTRFTNCQSLKNISIPSGVREFGDHMFNGCASLDELTIPDGVVYLDDDMLSGSNLSRVNIPSTCNFVYEGALGYTPLGDITKPLKLRVISGFSMARSIVVDTMDHTNLENRFLSLRHAALLQKIRIVSHIDRISSGAFFNVKGLKEILFEDVSNMEIEKAAFYYVEMDELILPEGLKIIDEGAFDTCSFNRVVLPRSLVYIGKNAFKHTRIGEINIPSGVEEIGESFISDMTDGALINVESAKRGAKWNSRWRYNFKGKVRYGVDKNGTKIGG